MSDGFGGRVLRIDVGEPKGSRNILDNEFQGRILALANTLMKELLNEVARFELLAILLLPPSSGTILCLNETLAEDMIEDVFQIVQLAILELKLNELGGSGQMGPRSKLIGKPEFVGVRHCYDEVKVGC